MFLEGVQGSDYLAADSLEAVPHLGYALAEVHVDASIVNQHVVLGRGRAAGVSNRENQTTHRRYAWMC